MFIKIVVCEEHWQMPPSFLISMIRNGFFSENKVNMKIRVLCAPWCSLEMLEETWWCCFVVVWCLWKRKPVLKTFQQLQLVHVCRKGGMRKQSLHKLYCRICNKQTWNFRSLIISFVTCPDGLWISSSDFDFSVFLSCRICLNKSSATARFNI